jgi:hypothetical protein
MRICLFFVLLLNAFTFAASSLDEEKTARRALIEKLDDVGKKHLADMRDSLLTSLQEKDVDAVFRYVKLLTDSTYGDYALDKYELLQIYFLTNQLDSAIVTLVRDYDEHMYSHRDGYHLSYYKKQWYSAFDDKLIDYLDANMDLTKREFLQEQLSRIMNSDVSPDCKDLADLMSMEFSRDVIKNKYKACHLGKLMTNICYQEDFINEMRYGFSDEVFVEKDTVFYDSLISKIADFQIKQSMPKFASWAKKQLDIEKENRKIAVYSIQRIDHSKEKQSAFHANDPNCAWPDCYYIERLYTGGIGFELFAGMGIELALALQNKIFILDLGLTVDNEEYGGYLTLGVDVYESRFFKVIPFVGWRNPFVAGLQLEYRPWISKQTDKFSVGEYFTVKAKLEMRYGYASMENDEGDCNGADACSGLVEKESDKGPRKLRPHIFGGVGFHFW